MILFGMECRFTMHFLQAIAPYHPIELLVLPAHVAGMTTRYVARPQLLATQPRVADIAHALGITVVYLAHWHDIQPYLPRNPHILVCCYPRRLPHWLITYPTCNIHPSLLPALRGPDPLFYTARGDEPPGVTLHQLDAEFDTGPIIVQQPVDIHDVADEAAYIAIHAQTAATLLNTQDIWRLPRSVQPDHGVSTAPWPHPAEYRLDATWTRLRMRRFLQWTNARAHPYWVPALHDWVSSLDEAITRRVPCCDGELT